MTTFFRKCPICGCEITYSNKYGLVVLTKKWKDKIK